MATMDTVLEKLIINLAAEQGGSLRATGALSGDDGEAALEQRVAINQFGLNTNANTGVTQVNFGGREIGGAYRYDFGPAALADAIEFRDDVQGVVEDFRDLLKKGGATADTDVVEGMLKRVATAFDGTLIADANFSGDDLADGVNLAGPNSRSINDGANDGVEDDGVVFGGTSTSGSFRFDFDDADSAARFKEVADELLDWAIPIF